MRGQSEGSTLAAAVWFADVVLARAGLPEVLILPATFKVRVVFFGGTHARGQGGGSEG